MSKAGSAGGGKSGEKAVAREFVLKVAMHCRCQGCTPKLRSAVNKLRRQPGVVTVDQSATEAAEELRVVAAADPEGLRKLVNKAMGNKKKVDLVLTPPKPIKKASGRGSSGNKDPRLVDAHPVQVRRADDSCPPSSGEGRVLATADTERLRKRVNKPTGKKVDSLILIPPKSMNKISGGGSSEKAEPRLVNAHPCPPSSGEVRVLATVDTERLRKRVNKPTGKKVDIIFPPKPINKSSGGGSSKKEDPNLVDAPAMKELQADPQLEAVPVSDKAYSCLPTSYYPGVLAVERKATESKEEMRVLATGSSERLRKRVNKPTGKKKKAEPVFTPKPMPIDKSSGGGKEGPRLVDAPAVMELEPDPQLEAVLANMWRVPPSLDHHRQYVGHGAATALAGNNDQHHRVGHGLAAAAGAYPCPPSSYYPSQAEASASAYPTTAPAPPGCYCPPSAPPWPFGLDYN